MTQRIILGAHSNNPFASYEAVRYTGDNMAELNQFIADSRRPDMPLRITPPNALFRIRKGDWLVRETLWEPVYPTRIMGVKPKPKAPTAQQVVCVELLTQKDFNSYWCMEGEKIDKPLPPWLDVVAQMV